MTYQLTATDLILRLEDGAFIPPDPANTDYQKFLLWCEEGNTPEPAPEPEPVPEPEPAIPFSLLEKLTKAGLTLEEIKSLVELK